MSPRWFLALIAATIILAACLPTRAQEHHHLLHEDFYSKWQRPGGMGSCCNERKINERGDEVGDCSPTEAELRRNKAGEVHWFARTPHGGDFIEIPDDKVIREINPDPTGQDAHLCYDMGTVYCFVPSTGAI